MRSFFRYLSVFLVICSLATALAACGSTESQQDEADKENMTNQETNSQSQAEGDHALDGISSISITQYGRCNIVLKSTSSSGADDDETVKEFREVVSFLYKKEKNGTSNYSAYQELSAQSVSAGEREINVSENERITGLILVFKEGHSPRKSDLEWLESHGVDYMVES